MEVLTEFYCHGRLPDAITASMSSTEASGSSKSPLIIGTLPRMILFPVQPSAKKILSQSLVDAPGSYQILIKHHVVDAPCPHPIRITHHVVQPLSLQDITFFEKFTQLEDFRTPTQALRDEHQIRIGSLIIGLDSLDERLVLLLGDHNEEHKPRVVRDVADFSWSSKVNTKNSRRSLRTSTDLILTTKHLREQRMPNSKRYWADFMSNIVQYHMKCKTSETYDILHGLAEGRTFYLITGLRTFLDPKLEALLIRSSPLNKQLPRGAQSSHIAWAGSKVAALELCRITVKNDPSPFKVKKPKWYILWGPLERGNKLWPPKLAEPPR